MQNLLNDEGGTQPRCRRKQAGWLLPLPKQGFMRVLQVL